MGPGGLARGTTADSQAYETNREIAKRPRRMPRPAGHAIPHTLGGLTDINLVPQLGRINVGPFRELERLAVATPGALYFTYWKYGRSTATQRPEGVDQGLLRPGRPAEIRRHPN